MVVGENRPRRAIGGKLGGPSCRAEGASEDRLRLVSRSVVFPSNLRLLLGFGFSSSE